MTIGLVKACKQSWAGHCKHSFLFKYTIHPRQPISAWTLHNIWCGMVRGMALNVTEFWLSNHVAVEMIEQTVRPKMCRKWRRPLQLNHLIPSVTITYTAIYTDLIVTQLRIVEQVLYRTTNILVVPQVVIHFHKTFDSFWILFLLPLQQGILTAKAQVCGLRKVHQQPTIQMSTIINLRQPH